MINKCIICKNPTKPDDVLCERARCQDAITTRKNLVESIKHYTEFFRGKTPTDELYKQYLEAVGLEENYKKFAYDTEDGNPKLTRRVWFVTNVAQCHVEWPDEFGRLYGRQEY